MSRARSLHHHTASSRTLRASKAKDSRGGKAAYPACLRRPIQRSNRKLKMRRPWINKKRCQLKELMMTPCKVYQKWAEELEQEALDKAVRALGIFLAM